MRAKKSNRRDSVREHTMASLLLERVVAGYIIVVRSQEDIFQGVMFPECAQRRYDLWKRSQK